MELADNDKSTSDSSRDEDDDAPVSATVKLLVNERDDDILQSKAFLIAIARRLHKARQKITLASAYLPGGMKVRRNGLLSLVQFLFPNGSVAMTVVYLFAFLSMSLFVWYAGFPSLAEVFGRQPSWADVLRQFPFRLVCIHVGLSLANIIMVCMCPKSNFLHSYIQTAAFRLTLLVGVLALIGALFKHFIKPVKVFFPSINATQRPLANPRPSIIGWVRDSVSNAYQRQNRAAQSIAGAAGEKVNSFLADPQVSNVIEKSKGGWRWAQSKGYEVAEDALSLMRESSQGWMDTMSRLSGDAVASGMKEAQRANRLLRELVENTVNSSEVAPVYAYAHSVVRNLADETEPSMISTIMWSIWTFFVRAMMENNSFLVLCIICDILLGVLALLGCLSNPSAVQTLVRFSRPLFSRFHDWEKNRGTFEVLEHSRWLNPSRVHGVVAWRNWRSQGKDWIAMLCSSQKQTYELENLLPPSGDHSARHNDDLYDITLYGSDLSNILVKYAVNREEFSGVVSCDTDVEFRYSVSRLEPEGVKHLKIAIPCFCLDNGPELLIFSFAMLINSSNTCEFLERPHRVRGCGTPKLDMEHCLTSLRVLSLSTHSVLPAKCKYGMIFISGVKSNEAVTIMCKLWALKFLPQDVLPITLVIPSFLQQTNTMLSSLTCQAHAALPAGEIVYTLAFREGALPMLHWVNTEKFSSQYLKNVVLYEPTSSGLELDYTVTRLPKFCRMTIYCNPDDKRPHSTEMSVGHMDPNELAHLIQTHPQLEAETLDFISKRGAQPDSDDFKFCRPKHKASPLSRDFLADLMDLLAYSRPGSERVTTLQKSQQHRNIFLYNRRAEPSGRF